MKAKLEFKLPEERFEFEAATNGTKWMSALYDLDQELRAIIKYNEDYTSEQKQVFQEARDMIYQKLEHYSLAFVS